MKNRFDNVGGGRHGTQANANHLFVALTAADGQGSFLQREQRSGSESFADVMCCM
jgi:hypothetical protein